MYCSIARYDWFRRSLLAQVDDAWTEGHKDRRSTHLYRESPVSDNLPAMTPRVRDRFRHYDRQMRDQRLYEFAAQVQSIPKFHCLLNRHMTTIHRFQEWGAQLMGLWFRQSGERSFF